MFSKMSTLITDTDQALLRQGALTAEQAARLTPAQLDLIYQHKWFHLFVPEALGGLEMPLPEALRLEETLAAIDGSLGWTITLCAGAAWFAGFLDQALATEIFSDPKACLGGSGAASGRATREGTGYRISGQWRFATGAPHLSHFTANCQLADEQGRLLLNEDGSPRIGAFIFPRQEVEILPDWRAMGLVATASHTFRVTDLWVPQQRYFIIDAAHARLPQPVYQYPFLPFAAATLAVNYCGMALHFLTLSAALFKTKHKAFLHELHQGATQEIETAREAFYETVITSWEAVSSGQPLSKACCEAVNQKSAQLADVCLRKVDLLFPYCGMAGADKATEINQVWRDIHTASQHGLLRELM